MDNRQIDIRSEGEKDFSLAMQLATGKHSGYKTIGYSIESDGSIMALYWSKHEKMIPLPYEMNTAEITTFVWGWLQKTKPQGQEPDHDGDNRHGFRVYNEAWGTCYEQMGGIYCNHSNMGNVWKIKRHQMPSRYRNKAFS